MPVLTIKPNDIFACRSSAEDDSTPFAKKSIVSIHSIAIYGPRVPMVTDDGAGWRGQIAYIAVETKEFQEDHAA